MARPYGDALAAARRDSAFGDGREGGLVMSRHARLLCAYRRSVGLDLRLGGRDAARKRMDMFS